MQKEENTCTSVEEREYVILHHTGAEEKDTEHIRRNHIARGFRDIGYNFVIERDGKIVEGRSLDIAGAHCKEDSMNTRSIGVALIGNLEERKPTPEQVKSTITLLKTLSKDYDNILGHGEVKGAKTLCPGKFFPIKEIKESVYMYKDVKPDAWYAESLKKASEYGLMMGVGEGLFAPDRTTTRAEQAVVAVRIYEASNPRFVKAIKGVLPAIVQVENGTRGSLGSGTIIHEDGYVLTNEHVIREATNVGFRSPDNVFGGANYAMGPVLAFDASKDLAICKIQLPTKFPVAKVSFEKPPKTTRVLAIGSPLGLIRSVSDGIISAYRTRNGVNYIQTDTAINPGNSGGALVDIDGTLIGVPTLKYVGEAIDNLGLCVVNEEVRKFILDNNLPEELKKVVR